jgi:hypothetical protein
MDRFARRDVLAVLARFGVTSARRATTVDTTEEVILLAEADVNRVDVAALTAALYEVLPHTKVWVTEDGIRWTSEDL